MSKRQVEPQAIAPKMEDSSVKKSRLVPPESRRRAAFSCDRCKSKKIKCERVIEDENPSLHDRSHPCSNCLKWELECITTVPRRRRVYASFENLGTHYQTVIQLVQGLYPEVDINDVNALAALGESLGINMGPEGSQDDMRNIEVESKILKPFTPTAMEHTRTGTPTGSVDASRSMHSVGSTGTNGSQNVQYPPQKTQETMVYDSSGGTHYVGSSGTPSLFTLLCNLLLKRSLVPTLSFDNKITLFRNGPDRKADYKETYVSLLKNPSFPLLKLVKSREMADYIVDMFFRKVHPFYFIFDHEEFTKNHDLYWKLLLSDEPTKMPRRDLPNTTIGCIYLVYLLGSKILDASMISQFDSSNIEEILQLILTDASLGASVSSIQFLFLYATHLHSEKNRDACWSLIGLAIRQATSLGLHKSVSQVENKQIQSQLFWSLYQQEMFLCLNFGRQSIINESEVDIAYPDLSQTSAKITPEFIRYHRSSIQMSRFLSQVVKERRITQQPLALINIERTLSLKTHLLKLRDELQIKPFTQIENIYDFKLSLMFHHYMASITLPMIVYVTTTNFKMKDDETILGIVKLGVQSAIITSKILGSAASREDFHNGAISLDCMMGYNTALLLSLFLIYLCNTSNDLWDLVIDCEGTLEKVDKNATLHHISQISDFMEKSKLDPTTKRIAEITHGLRNDLNLVALQEDVRFDNVSFEGADQLVYDSLVFNNDIYLDGWF